MIYLTFFINNMWKVKYKPNNNSQAWATLDSYDNKAEALLHAARVSSEYYRVSVIGPDGDITWSHCN